MPKAPFPEYLRERGYDGELLVVVADEAEELTRVWRAQKDGRTHAIKERICRTQWRTEQDALWMLAHPNIAGCTDAFIERRSNHPYVLVQPLCGTQMLPRTLHSPVGTSPHTTLEQYVGYLVDVSDALAYCHANGVIHTDLTERNVVIDGKRATLVDFGVAKPRGLLFLETDRSYLSHWPPEKRGRYNPFHIATPSIDIYSVLHMLDLTLGNTLHRRSRRFSDMTDGPGDHIRALLNQRPKTAEELMRRLEDLLGERETERLGQCLREQQEQFWNRPAA